MQERGEWVRGLPFAKPLPILFVLFHVACCSQSCQNGAKCNTPNRCACSSGWTGRDCSIGTCIYTWLYMYIHICMAIYVHNDEV